MAEECVREALMFNFRGGDPIIWLAAGMALTRFSLYYSTYKFSSHNKKRDGCAGRNHKQQT